MSDTYLFIFGIFVTILAIGPLVLAGLTDRDDGE